MGEKIIFGKALCIAFCSLAKKQTRGYYFKKPP